MERFGKAQGTFGSSRAARIALRGLGIAAGVVLAAILCANCILLAGSYANPGKAATVGGWSPLIVLTDSMEPQFSSGDLVLSKSADVNQISPGDIISFYDPASASNAVVTHRVVGVEQDADGTLLFQTQGDANNAPDDDLVPAQNVVGSFACVFPGLGNICLFMQSDAGRALCVLLAAALFMFFWIGPASKRKNEPKAGQSPLITLRA